MTVDGDGNIIIQEDPGNSAYIAKVWKFTRPASRRCRFSSPTAAASCRVRLAS